VTATPRGVDYNNDVSADVPVTDLTGNSHEYCLFLSGVPESSKQEMVNTDMIKHAIDEELQIPCQEMVTQDADRFSY
jgi:hypothetical protein